MLALLSDTQLRLVTFPRCARPSKGQLRQEKANTWLHMLCCTKSRREVVERSTAKLLQTASLTGQKNVNSLTEFILHLLRQNVLNEKQNSPHNPHISSPRPLSVSTGSRTGETQTVSNGKQDVNIDLGKKMFCRFL